MTFKEKPVAIIWAKDGDTGEYSSFSGVNKSETNSANAVAQLNKILGIAGKSVLEDGMTLICTKEAKDNG